MKHFTHPAIKTPDLPLGHQMIGAYGVILGGPNPKLGRISTSLVLSVNENQQGYLAVTDDYGRFIGVTRHADTLDKLDYFAELDLKHWDTNLTIQNPSVLHVALNAYWAWRERLA